MHKKLIVSIAVLLTCQCCPAESSKPLRIAIYPCPAARFMESNDIDGGKQRTPVDGVKKVEESPFYGDGNVFDVQGYFKLFGINSPHGAQAFLIERKNLLFVKDTAKNIRLIEKLGFGSSVDASILLRTEFFVVQFNSTIRKPELPLPTFFELRKAAGRSWKQLCGMEVLSKPGQVGRAENATGVIPQDEKYWNPQKELLLPNETGASCAIQSELLGDSYTIESTLLFCFQSQKDHDGKSQTITYNGSDRFWDGQTQVLQIYDGPDATTAFALLIRITVIDPQSVPIKTTGKRPDLPRNADGTIKGRPSDWIAKEQQSVDASIKLSISFGLPAFSLAWNEITLPLTFTATNTGTKDIALHYYNSNRGLMIYIINDDGTKAVIYPFDSREGKVDNGIHEAVTGGTIPPGKTGTETIQIPIALADSVTGKVVASIWGVIVGESPQYHEVFSAPFSFPEVKKR